MYYITTPLPYVNGQPHLGHLLEHVFNDTIRRYRERVENQEVVLQYGADQHGLKVLQKAQELNIDPAIFVREKTKTFEAIWDKYNCKSDVFIETDSDNHKILCQIIFKILLQKGYIYKKTYKGLYCVGCEDFYAPSQLSEDGNCPIHCTKPTQMAEENYFFALSKFEEPIKNYLKNANIKPKEESTQWLNFMSEGLQDMSMSREKARMSWGIEMPLTDGSDSGQVMYVWFEALQNYWTALINPETFDRWREMPDLRAIVEEEILSELVENLPIDFMYLGKDIAKFHLVVWIGLHIAMGFELPEYLPQNALVHGFINDSKGRKFSKSLDNGVLPEDLFEEFGVDGTRFIMLHEVNVFGDTNFDLNHIRNSYNSNLADNLGNMVMRISTLIEKHFGGVIDLETVEMIDLDVNLADTYRQLQDFNPQKAMQELFAQSRKINEFLEINKPWTLAKDMENNRSKIKSILGQSTLAILEVGKALSIFLPESGAKIVEIFQSTKITKAQVLFQKIEIK